VRHECRVGKHCDLSQLGAVGSHQFFHQILGVNFYGRAVHHRHGLLQAVLLLQCYDIAHED
jgi:hypothetical protein